MNQRLVVFALVAAPSLALAQGDAPPPPPAPAAPPAEPAAPPPPAQPAPQASPSTPMVMPMPAQVESPNGPPLEGWQLQARLPTNIGADSLLSPGFSIGHRSGNFVLAAELGITGGKFSTDNGDGTSDSTSLFAFQIVPMIYDDVWTSADGRARMNLVGGIGYGRASVTTDTSNGMGGTNETTSYASYLPILAGLGGDYYLHKNFAIGVEFGAFVPVLLSVNSGGMDAKVSGNLESARGLIRFTFVTGQ